MGSTAKVVARLKHSWDLTPGEAIETQKRLCKEISVRNRQGLGDIKAIGGADCAFDGRGGIGYAGVVVYTYPGLEEVQRVGRRGAVSFPYVPGLLSFREAPLLLEAIDKLKALPDLLIFDGHGIAHPRRFGIASHLGVLLDRPTIGCAKSRLVGEHRMPAQAPGSIARLEQGDELLGHVLRTRRGVKPVFVSVGHAIELETATRVIMSCVDKYRIPKPTREADRYVAHMKSRYKA